MSAIAAQAINSAIDRMPFEEYIGLEGIHATALKDMLVSPRLYDWRRKYPREDTDSLRVGRAGHTAILEPDRFALEYAVWRKSQGIRRGKTWDAFCTANAGRTILTEAQYETALAMRDSARSHPRVKELLDEQGRAEITIRWTHPRTGLPCVSRIDYLCSAVVDIKTARSVHPAKFSADAVRFGYLLQAGFYGDAVASLGLGAMPFKFVVVQNVAPFDCVVFNLPTALIAHGAKQYEDAIDRLMGCRAAKTWPGIAPSGEVDLMLPAWAAVEQDEGPDDSPISDVEF